MEIMDQHIPEMLALLRGSIWQQPYTPAVQVDYDAMWRELKLHTIQNLCVDLLAAADPANQMRYLASGAKNCAAWYRLMGVQQTITHVLDKAEIPCAVLKGAAADLAYPQPLNRSMGDIDLLVKPTDFDRAMALLLDNGCLLHDVRNPRHTELRMNGVQIELHRHFAVLSDAKRASHLDRMLFDSLDRVQLQEIEGYHFYSLPPLENGLVLLEHINSHMASGLGLRQIIDWMLYVQQALDDDAWFGEFQAVAQTVHLEKLAVTVTRMCQMYLGLREDISWCRFADRKLCQRLMEHIIGQGNFGNKLDRRSHGAVKVLNALRSDGNFFRLLQRHGCYNWKALQKHPWLRPFAWLYQLCRYIRKALSGGRITRTFQGIFQKQRRNSDLLADLGVQQKNHRLDYDE